MNWVLQCKTVTMFSWGYNEKIYGKATNYFADWMEANLVETGDALCDEKINHVDHYSGKLQNGGGILDFPFKKSIDILVDSGQYPFGVLCTSFTRKFDTVFSMSQCFR